MGEWISYTIVAGVVLLALYIVYGWLLAAENQPRFNRAVILSCYAVAAVVPLIGRISWPETALAGTEVAIGDPMVTVAEGTDEAALWPLVVTGVYLAGVVAVFIGTLTAWWRLHRITRKACLTPCGRYTLAVIDDDDIAPFSWNRYIVMSSSDYAENGEVIIVHETAHLDKGHRFDLMVARLFEALIWYNPATWLMTRALRSVHEYEADRQVVNSVSNPRDYQMLLIKKAVGRSFPAFANSLNHSNLKKRITMMLKSQSGKSRRVRALALVPAAALALLSVNLPFAARALDSVSSVTIAVNSQDGDKVTQDSSTVQSPAAQKNEKVWDTPEQLPQYPGGDAALMQFIAENIQYPQSELNNPGRHTVLVTLVIQSDGSVGNVKVRRSAGEAFDAEAIRVVNLLERFTPGKINGVPVAVNYALPIRFQAK